MSKRRADTELDRDAEEQEVEAQYQKGETWKKADPEVLAKRKIVTVRKTLTNTNTSSESAPAPKFDFGLSSSTATEQPAAEPAKEQPAAEPEKEPAKEPAKEQPAAEPPKEENPLFALMAAQKAKWECPTCMTQNEKTVPKCIACEEKNPNYVATEADKQEEQSEFTFGAADTSSSSGSSGFEFTNNFSFDSSSSSTGGFTFGDSSGVTFGSIAESGSGFSFDSSSSAAPFKFETPSAEEHQEGENGEENPEAAEPQQEFEKVEMPGKAEPSGEENDVVLYTLNNVVAYQVKEVEVKETSIPSEEAESKPKKTEKKFVESGKGELRINQHNNEETKKVTARIILRAEKTRRLVLSAPLLEVFSSSIQTQGEKWIRFNSLDLELQPAAYALKFANKSEQQATLEAMKKALTTISPL